MVKKKKKEQASILVLSQRHWQDFNFTANLFKSILTPTFYQ